MTVIGSKTKRLFGGKSLFEGSPNVYCNRFSSPPPGRLFALVRSLGTNENLLRRKKEQKKKRGEKYSIEQTIDNFLSSSSHQSNAIFSDQIIDILAFVEGGGAKGIYI